VVDSETGRADDRSAAICAAARGGGTSDWISLIQKVCGRLVSPELFAFRTVSFTDEGPRPDPLRDRQTRLGMKVGTRWFSRRYEGVPGRVHVHDDMLRGDSPEDIAHYVRVGLSAMENVEAALAAARLSFDRIGACLDMACGYGRVLRWLIRRVPPRCVTACDLNPEAVRFLSEEFGVEAVGSARDPRAVRFPRAYDLIWVGSLFTHLTPGAAMDFLELLARALRPGGVLIFSTQGPSCLAHLARYGEMFEGKAEEFSRQLQTGGAAYLRYFEANPDYGIAVYSSGYIRRGLAGRFGGRLRRVRLAERGWDEHQDVYAFQRVGSQEWA
jgi:SAM-dependent methyltransferase